MSLTLDPSLAAAQDSLERKPIISLNSTQIAEAIPFDGQIVDPLETSGSKPSMVKGSTGQIFSTYTEDGDINFMYTDEDRNYWTKSLLFSGANYTESVVVELSDGNLGIILIHNSLVSSSSLRYAKIQIDGTIITSPVEIENLNPTIISGIGLIKLPDDSYLLTYVKNDSGTYTIEKRTSSDFITWSSESSLTLVDLDSTHPMYKTSLVQVDDGDIFLFFDYADDIREDGSVIANIYKMVSSDSGSSWDTPEAITTYSEWGVSGKYPWVSLNTDNTINLTFHEENNVLFMDSTSPNWLGSCSPDYTEYEGTDIHFDPSTNRLYAYQIYTSIGNKVLCGIVSIDTANWEVDKSYTNATSPAYNAMFSTENVWYHRDHGEGHYAVSSTKSYNHCGILLIDDANESITQYFLKDSATYLVNRNVSGINYRTGFNESNARISSTWLDVDSNKLFIHMFFASPYGDSFNLVGYIDITETAVGGYYTFNEVYYDGNDSLFTEEQLLGEIHLHYIKESGYLLMSSLVPVEVWQGKLNVLNVNNGGLVKEYTFAGNPTFPYQGVGYLTYYNNSVFASFLYRTYNSQDNYRGLVEINISNDTIQYHRPDWATVDSYGLGMKKSMGDGRILIAASIYGVAIYDTSSGDWTLFDNSNLPGFEPDEPSNVTSVEYDSVNNIIFCGSTILSSHGFSGVRAFSEDGSFNQGKLSTGTLSGTWSFSEPSQFSQGLTDSEFTTTVDDDNVIFSAWKNRNVSDYFIKWDRDVADLLLNSFLTGSVSISWSIEGNNSLSFSLSNGHLFEPNNTLSSYNPFLQKGRRIDVQMGENIGGINYYHNQGSFIVKTTKLSYSRGDYPTISVQCEDIRCLWDEMDNITSDRYDGSFPEDVLTDLLEDYALLDISDIDIPELETRHEIYYQWIDENLSDILKEILDHFGYVSYMDVDNNYTVKKIDTNASVDHVYTGSEIISYSPDDNFSSFVNKVIVNGEEIGFIEVVYPEELIKAISGTGGWWSDKDKVEKIYYSDDKEMKARNPRLVKKKSIKDFKVLWQRSKGDEYISEIDIEEKYVELTIEYPGLMEVLIAAIGTLTTIGYAAATCDVRANCGSYQTAFSIATAAVAWILGQTATYEYEIYAQPLGEEKQSIYSYAEDTELQNYLNGTIISTTITDPLCYTIEICKDVAERELDVVKAQRKRIVIEKIAHLQDEIADTISIKHPFTNQTMNVFITDINRVYTKSVLGSDSGSVIDTITGWVR